MIVVRYPGLTDRRPPFVGRDRRGVHVPHPIADVIVIADRVEGLPFGVVTPAFEQLRVEDLFFDVGVHVQLVGERAPHSFEGGLVVRAVGLQIVQSRELFPKPLMVGKDQHGDVCHWRVPPLCTPVSRAYPVYQLR
jgi:hypothetical protein